MAPDTVARLGVAHVDANADPMHPNIDHNNGLEVWRELLENLQPAEMSGVQDLAEGFETFSQAAEKQALLEAELSKLRAELAQAKEQIVNQGTALVAMEVDRDKAATASEEKLAALKKLQQQELVQVKADLKSAFQGETPGTAIQQTSPQNCVRVLIQTAAKAARLGDNEGLATGLEEIQKKQELYLPESVEDKKLVGKARVSAPTPETPDGCRRSSCRRLRIL